MLDAGFSVLSRGYPKGASTIRRPWFPADPLDEQPSACQGGWETVLPEVGKAAESCRKS